MRFLLGSRVPDALLGLPRQFKVGCRVPGVPSATAIFPRQQAQQVLIRQCPGLPGGLGDTVHATFSPDHRPSERELLRRNHGAQQWHPSTSPPIHQADHPPLRATGSDATSEHPCPDGHVEWVHVPSTIRVVEHAPQPANVAAACVGISAKHGSTTDAGGAEQHHARPWDQPTMHLRPRLPVLGLRCPSIQRPDVPLCQ